MLATMAGQSDVVNLLKNKYGQQEPSPEAVSSLVVFCMYKHTHTHTHTHICTYVHTCACIQRRSQTRVFAQTSTSFALPLAIGNMIFLEKTHIVHGLLSQCTSLSRLR